MGLSLQEHLTTRRNPEIHAASDESGGSEEASYRSGDANRCLPLQPSRINKRNRIPSHIGVPVDATQ